MSESTRTEPLYSEPVAGSGGTEDASVLDILADLLGQTDDQNQQFFEAAMQAGNQSREQLVAFAEALRMLAGKKESPKSETAEIIRALGDVGLQYIRETREHEESKRKEFRESMLELAKGPLAAYVDHLFRMRAPFEVFSRDPEDFDNGDEEPEAETGDTDED